MTDFPVNPPLADDVLARRDTLPMKPAGITLNGQIIRLQPLDIERDSAVLFARSNGKAATMGDKSIAPYDADKLIWRYMSGGVFESAAALAAWLQAQVDTPNGQPFTVFDVVTASPIGVANLMSNVPAHLSIELGNIWYSPLAQKTGANTEATYLMLKHVFSLGYRRVVWKCDALNTRSREAALKLGFQFEGIHEQHYIIKGRNRDTAWFRLLASEWDGVRQQLETRLYS